jgi:hypothetical protein
LDKEKNMSGNENPTQKATDQKLLARCPWCSQKPGGPLPPESIKLGMQLVQMGDFLIGVIFCGYCHATIGAQIIGQQEPTILPGTTPMPLIRQ